MVDPNKDPKRIFNYGDIAKDRENETPDPRDFIDDPYSREEVERDMKKLAEIRSRESHDDIGLRSADIHEYATQQEMGEMDWFHEDDRGEELFPDDKGHQMAAFLTSDYDDHLNHVDVVCVMDNACSDFEPVPFALDLTYRSDADWENSEKMDKKFSWRHRSRNIGTKGFCEVKYFEDDYNMEPLLPKGRIGAMPRFVVGYSEELAEKITEERMMSTGWDSLSRMEPSGKAKFCVLHELVQQSEQMMEYLEKHHDTPELQQLQTNVEALNKYFSGALEAARENDKMTHYESYANRDAVAQSIMLRKITD